MFAQFCRSVWQADVRVYTTAQQERERWGGRCRKGPCACVLCDCVSVFVNGQVLDEYAYSHTHNSLTEPLQESLHVLKHLTHTHTPTRWSQCVSQPNVVLPWRRDGASIIEGGIYMRKGGGEDYWGWRDEGEKDRLLLNKSRWQTSTLTHSALPSQSRQTHHHHTHTQNHPHTSSLQQSHLKECRTNILTETP